MKNPIAKITKNKLYWLTVLFFVLSFGGCWYFFTKSECSCIVIENFRVGDSVISYKVEIIPLFREGPSPFSDTKEEQVEWYIARSGKCIKYIMYLDKNKKILRVESLKGPEKKL